MAGLYLFMGSTIYCQYLTTPLGCNMGHMVSLLSKLIHICIGKGKSFPVSASTGVGLPWPFHWVQWGRCWWMVRAFCCYCLDNKMCYFKRIKSSDIILICLEFFQYWMIWPHFLLLNDLEDKMLINLMWCFLGFIYHV